MPSYLSFTGAPQTLPQLDPETTDHALALYGPSPGQDDADGQAADLQLLTLGPDRAISVHCLILALQSHHTDPGALSCPRPQVQSSSRTARCVTPARQNQHETPVPPPELRDLTRTLPGPAPPRSSPVPVLLPLQSYHPESALPRVHLLLSTEETPQLPLPAQQTAAPTYVHLHQTGLFPSHLRAAPLPHTSPDASTLPKRPEQPQRPHLSLSLGCPAITVSIHQYTPSSRALVNTWGYHQPQGYVQPGPGGLTSQHWPHILVPNAILGLTWEAYPAP